MTEDTWPVLDPLTVVVLDLSNDVSLLASKTIEASECSGLSSSELELEDSEDEEDDDARDGTFSSSLFELDPASLPEACSSSSQAA